jgi:hypothetical protein
MKKNLLRLFLTVTMLPVGNFLLAQNVGIGTLAPQYKLHVVDTSPTIKRNAIFALLGSSTLTSIASQAVVYGASREALGIIGLSTTQNGVYGYTSAAERGGIVGVNVGAGYGIWGIISGTGIAGYFDGGSAGRGLAVKNGASGFGLDSPKNRLSVIQPATATELPLDTFAAIYAYSNTVKGSLKGGVLGTYNTAQYGTGVQGLGYGGTNNIDANSVFALGNQDLGVYGSANTVGVQGTSTGGIGVAGYNKTSSYAAVTGGGSAYGLYGYANTIGGAVVPAIRYGVYAYATGAATNYAGFFSGDVMISGTVAKASGTFKIDHPLDPANKYLYHSFVESPDMMNVYNGNITTDATGKATVTLPAYFEAENKDFKYQLTIVDETQFAQARISKKVSANTFVIATDKPNIEVSWQVTGVRQDKYANAHRVITEVEKEAQFKGHYLHPKEWNMPEEMGIDFLTRPKTTPDNKNKNTSNTAQPAKTVALAPAANGTVTIGGVEIKEN